MSGMVNNLTKETTMINKNLAFSEELFALIEEQQNKMAQETFTSCVRRLLLEAIRAKEKEEK
jgi:hypothetical protein